MKPFSFRLEPGALIQEVTAIHISIHPNAAISLSTQIAALRFLLSGDVSGSLEKWFNKVRQVITLHPKPVTRPTVYMYSQGEMPLVVEVDNADIMASLIALKAEIQSLTQKPLHLTFSGGAEAHLLAQELGAANVGVILRPSRSSPKSWESRRM